MFLRNKVKQTWHGNHLGGHSEGSKRRKRVVGRAQRARDRNMFSVAQIRRTLEDAEITDRTTVIPSESTEYFASHSRLDQHPWRRRVNDAR